MKVERAQDRGRKGLISTDLRGASKTCWPIAVPVAETKGLRPGVLGASITSVFDALGYGPLVVRGGRPADEVERILPESGKDWLFSPNFVALRFARIDR